MAASRRKVWPADVIFMGGIQTFLRSLGNLLSFWQQQIFDKFWGCKQRKELQKSRCSDLIKRGKCN